VQVGCRHSGEQRRHDQCQPARNSGSRPSGAVTGAWGTGRGVHWVRRHHVLTPVRSPCRQLRRGWRRVASWSQRCVRRGPTARRRAPGPQEMSNSGRDGPDIAVDELSSRVEQFVGSSDLQRCRNDGGRHGQRRFFPFESASVQPARSVFAILVVRKSEPVGGRSCMKSIAKPLPSSSGTSACPTRRSGSDRLRLLPDTQNGDAATRWVSTSQPAPGSPFSNGARRRQGPPLRSGPGERPAAALDPVSAPQEFAMREPVASPPIVSQRWSSRVAVNMRQTPAAAPPRPTRAKSPGTSGMGV